MQILSNQHNKTVPNLKYLDDCNLEFEYFDSSLSSATISYYLFNKHIDFYFKKCVFVCAFFCCVFCLFCFVCYLCLLWLEDLFKKTVIVRIFTLFQLFMFIVPIHSFIQQLCVSLVFKFLIHLYRLTILSFRLIVVG